MVSILERRRTNKNPFVKYLKGFNSIESSEAFIERLDNKRFVVFDGNELYFINEDYFSLGWFEIPIEELKENVGTIFFNVNPDDLSLEGNFQISYNSKKELYNLIHAFESINDEQKFKEVLLILQGVGFNNLRRNTVKGFDDNDVKRE